MKGKVFKDEVGISKLGSFLISKMWGSGKYFCGAEVYRFFFDGRDQPEIRWEADALARGAKLGPLHYINSMSRWWAVLSRSVTQRV